MILAMDSITKLCAICGTRTATTVDHVVPRAIFPKPRPELITVPACLECNQAASKHEEAFLVYLSLHVGVDTEDTKALWENHALPALRHNKKLRRRLLRERRSVYIQSRSGIIYDRRWAGLWDSVAHDIVVEKMIRGLYYYHFKEILGERATCRIQWLRELNKALLAEFEEGWGGNTIGIGNLVYRYGRAQEQPLYSCWLFQFYERHWASGYTEPIAEHKTTIERPPPGSLKRHEFKTQTYFNPIFSENAPIQKIHKKLDEWSQAEQVETE